MQKTKDFIFKIINTTPGGRLTTGFYLLAKNHLTISGWKNSVKKRRPVDQVGNELPWFTYSCIYFLNSRLHKEFTVFEYGSGNSTIWFSKTVKKVVSVEHDGNWYALMKQNFSDRPNITYLHKNLDSGTYQKEVLGYENNFDIIVLDGRERVACCMNSLKALKENGVIIWDNSDRMKYSKGYEFLLSKGFKRIDFFGMGPISAHSWCTSIFYKSNNCLQI